MLLSKAEKCVRHFCIHLINFLDGEQNRAIKKKQRKFFSMLIHKEKLFACLVTQIIRSFEINPILEHNVVGWNQFVEICISKKSFERINYRSESNGSPKPFFNPGKLLRLVFYLQFNFGIILSFSFLCSKICWLRLDYSFIISWWWLLFTYIWI